MQGAGLLLTGEAMAVNKGAAPGEEEGCELQAFPP